MSNSTRRLERVGTVVNPTQLFRMWMEEVHQYHALGDYTRSLVGKPDGAYPLVRLPAQMRAAVRQEMKGQAQEAVARAVDAAQRDVMFLFHLFMNANKNLIEVRRANWLEVTLLSVMDTHAGPDQAPSFGREPWAEAATRFLLDVYGEAGAVDYLTRRYFGGRSPLFPDLAEDSKVLVGHAEQMVELYNDACYKLGPRGKLVLSGRGEPIDVADVKKRSVAQATASVEQTVRLSKAETLVDRGERRAAVELIQQPLKEAL
jgi:hypothetical protein